MSSRPALKKADFGQLQAKGCDDKTLKIMLELLEEGERIVNY
jgi:hypothetical protein